MLSRKQLWRRVSSAKCMSSQYHTIYCDYDDSKSSITCSSNSTSSIFSSMESLHSYENSDSISNHKRSDNLPRGCTVSFSSKFEVCTIPTREELQYLHCEMYWNIEDVQLFKDEAYSEIFFLWKRINVR